MTISTNQIIGGVKDYLRNPGSLSQSDGIITERFFDRLAYYINQLNLTHENWYLEKYILPVNANQTDYVINAPNWGKPMSVEMLTDDGKVWGELGIRLFQDQNVAQYSNLPPSVAIPADWPALNEPSIAFYRSSGQMKARINPAPATSGRLNIWYEPSTISVSALDTAILFLSNFGNLLKIHTAIICLPDCEWIGYSDEKNAAMCARIEKTLLMEFALLTEQFNEYRQTMFQEQTSAREGYGEADECGDYGYDFM